MKPAIRKPGKMPYYRIRIFADYVDEERMSVLTLPSTDWFVSLEKDAKRFHYQGWILLDIPYDSSNNRKAKTYIKEHFPWKPMVKFQNGVWSLLDVDPEKFNEWKTYVAKEKNEWLGIFDKNDMLERHTQYWEKNVAIKKDRKQKLQNNFEFLTGIARKALHERKLEKTEYYAENSDLLKRHATLDKIHLQDIIDQVVRCNQSLNPVLDTFQLQKVILQIYATHVDTKEDYRMEECEILSRMFSNRMK